jgi:hypothetical protein
LLPRREVARRLKTRLPSEEEHHPEN